MNKSNILDEMVYVLSLKSTYFENAIVRSVVQTFK